MSQSEEAQKVLQDGAERRNQEEKRKKYHNKQADNVLVVKKGRIFCLNLRS